MKAIWKMSRKGKGPVYTIVNATETEIAQLEAIAAAKRLAGDPLSKVVYDELKRPLYYPSEELEVEIELAFNKDGTKFYPIGSVLDEMRDAFTKQRHPKLQERMMDKYIDRLELVAEEKAELAKQRLESEVGSKPATADLNP